MSMETGPAPSSGGREAGAEWQVVQDLCREALGRHDLREAAAILERAGVGEREAVRIVSNVTEDPATHGPIAALKSDALAQTLESRAVERVLLVRAVVDAVPRVRNLPVGGDVKTLLAREFRFMAGEPQDYGWFDAGSASFTGMCKLATFRRFPAGQFDWEVSGVSRRDVLGVGLRKLPATLAFIAFRMRGLEPVFFSHLNPRRANRSLLEVEANRSYYRMAQAMALQPEIKGFAACSWFRSPATHRVSPRLAWLSTLFLENGGMVVESRPEDPRKGALARSPTRQRLYEAGEFRPTRGLVLWPRDAMLAWAARHPEFGDAHTRA
jgi:hypothetical protein